MKLALIIAIALIVFIAIIYVVGMMLPQSHVATQTATFESPASEVWGVMTDVEKWPTWRKDITKVSKTSDSKFDATSNGDTIEYTISEPEAGKVWVTTITTPGLPYGGNWTYVLEPEGNGCKLTVTENGEVYNPIFRVISAYIMGHDGSLKLFVQNLKAVVR